MDPCTGARSRLLRRWTPTSGWSPSTSPTRCRSTGRSKPCGRTPTLRNADVLVLQEMDAPGVEAVARALHMNYVYYPVSLNPKYGRDFGNAILSPWPIEESRKVLLPHTSRILKQARAAVAARVRVGDRTVQVYSVHLGAPFGTSPGNRRKQAADDPRRRPRDLGSRDRGRGLQQPRCRNPVRGRWLRLADEVRRRQRPRLFFRPRLRARPASDRHDGRRGARREGRERPPAGVGGAGHGGSPAVPALASAPQGPGVQP